MDRLLLLLLLTGGSLLAQAQDEALDRTLLPQGRAAVRARMLKENVPFGTAWVDTLVAAASTAKPAVALRHLQHALVIADSLQDRGRERDLLFRLSSAQERVGKSKEALLSLRAAHFLKDSLATVELGRSAVYAAQLIEEEQRKWTQLQAEHAEAIGLAQEDHRVASERARMILIGGVIVIVLLLVALVWSLKRTALLILKQSTRATVEVQAMRPTATQPRQNALRPVATGPASPVEVSVPPADAEAEMLLALFHKRMPERVQALKEARLRSDQEKVLRVLASMRPQLTQHDGTRFTARCVRLIAAGERVLLPEFANELDRLIADVDQALQTSSGQA